MKKLFIMAGIFSLAGIGCAEPGLPESYNVQIDSAFSDQEIAIIEAGMSSWTGLSTDAPTFSFQVVSAFSMPRESNVPWSTIVIKKASLATIDSLPGAPASSEHVLAMTETNSVLCHDEDGSFNLNPKTIGPTEYLPGLTDLSTLESNTEGTFYKIAAHEAGHSMGLHHTGNGTIMSPGMSTASSKPTCADLEQYCSLRPGLKCDCNE